MEGQKITILMERKFLFEVQAQDYTLTRKRNRAVLDLEHAFDPDMDVGPEEG
jgi:hypothetical protein